MKIYINHTPEQPLPWQTTAVGPLFPIELIASGLPTLASFDSRQQLTQFIINSKIKLTPIFSRGIDTPTQQLIIDLCNTFKENPNAEPPQDI